ncbi:class I SAM-dependent methyltransferase [Roseivirga sp. BDSF3-8]|uniref:class I SAM-dependent methyltransferase n=1 Tax=Roseivirga sp. BDSF3-8 TaxID=3241598 RepID=UPI0035322DB3
MADRLKVLLCISKLLLFMAWFFSCGPNEKAGQDERIQKVKVDSLPLAIDNAITDKPDTTPGQAAPDLMAEDSTMFNLLVDTYEDPDRNAWQNPELVINKIESPFDKTVADIGAGTGYFTFRLARWARKVIALEVDPDFVAYLEERKQDVPEAIADRIDIRLTPADSAALEPGEADVALVVNTYYFLFDRVEYFQNIRKSLSDDGMVIVVDYKDKELPVASAYVRRISWEKVKTELQDAGYQNIRVDTVSLPYQYIVEAFR